MRGSRSRAEPGVRQIPGFALGLLIGLAAAALLALFPIGSGAASSLAPVVTPVPTVDVGLAIPAYCGSRFQGDTTGQPANVSTYACRPDWLETGPEQVYLFHFLEAQPVTMTLYAAQPAVDLDLFILTSSDPASCLAAGDNGIALPSLPAGRDYVVVVDGYEGSHGPYALAIDCPLGPQATATPTATPSPTPPPAPTATPTPTGTSLPGPQYLPLAMWRAVPTATPPTTNFAGQELLLARWNREAASEEKSPVLRFGLGPLPAGAHVVSAQLEVYAVERSVQADLAMAVFGLQRLWSVTAASWERATATQPWALPGANGVSSDRDAGPAGLTRLEATQRWYGFDVTHLVQRWQANPPGNAGVLLEAAARLIVRYWVPPT